MKKEKEFCITQIRSTLIAFAATFLAILFCGCGSTSDVVDGSSIPPESQTPPTQPEVAPSQPAEPEPDIQYDPTEVTEGEDDTPLIEAPDEAEKEAIMEEYELSEAGYNAYLKMWQNPGGGQEAGETLDAFIAGMEEQRAAHEGDKHQIR